MGFTLWTTAGFEDMLQTMAGFEVPGDIVENCSKSG